MGTAVETFADSDAVIGYLNGGAYKYADESGFDLDNQALVFRVKLPESADPY